MEKGTVAAHGTHGELLAGSVLYRSLWNDYLRGTGAEEPDPRRLRQQAEWHS